MDGWRTYGMNQGSIIIIHRLADNSMSFVGYGWWGEVVTT